MTTRLRIALLAAVVVAAGVGSAVAGDDLGAERDRPLRRADQLAALLTEGAAVVVGKDGKPLLGQDGKPLRVARDGRTLVDAQGRALRDRRGRPLRLRRDGTLPPAATGGRGGRRGTTPARPPRRGRRPAPAGGDRTPIVIGVAYNDAERLDAIFARYGGKGSASDGEQDAKAVADHINATGGIGGRPIQLRLREFDTTDGRPFDVTLAELCQFFAEGPRPAAVVTVANDEELAPCLADKGIPVINDWPTAGLTSLQTRLPGLFFQPGSLAIDRYAAPYVRALADLGFFDGNARVGFLRYSNPYFDAVTDGGLRPALRAAGVEIVAEQAFPYPQNVNEIGGIVAGIGSAVVRFRAAGVNRVISIDEHAILGLFAQAAEPQGYRPRYGVSSLNNPLFLRASLPPEQFRGAVGIGWSPLTDVAAEQEGELPAVRHRCSEIFAAAGVAKLGDRSPYGQFAAFSRCGNLLMLREALAGRDAASPAALRTAIEGLGTRFQSGVTFRTRLDAAHADGAAAYRVIRFDDGCSCFAYDGGPRAVD